MPGVQPRDRGNRVAGIHGVGSTAAMQVQVHEAGQHQRPHGIGARLGFADGLAIHGHDAAVVGTQVPLHEPVRREQVALDRQSGLHAGCLASGSEPG
jgi:hypothetical protein